MTKGTGIRLRMQTRPYVFFMPLELQPLLC